ncbi:MAG: glycosyltransferase family 4 protein [Opitutales bacterium]|nr:glycosyltransferase family 4 protein [Opitutales bacterium]
MLRIACVSGSYPTHLKYWRGTFVENFCVAVERAGCAVSVVIPESIQNIFAERAALFCGARVRRPVRLPQVTAPFLSLSRLAFHYGPLGTINRCLQERAVYRALNRLQERPDLVYAHFLGNALSSHRWCGEHQVPLVVVSGESSYKRFYASANRERMGAIIDSLHHVFFVSEKNRSAYRAYFGCLPERSSVLPNAVDTDRFRPQPKAEARKRLGLPTEAKIVAFVGYFIGRKGPLRVLKALEMREDLYGVFIGTGPQRPSGSRVLFAGTMENEQVADWLAACDVFALPSMEEGRSNAVIEALACGLPVVVSDRPFNREFLKEDCAVFVDPECSPVGLACAIDGVLSSSRRSIEMARAAREFALQFSLSARAEKFLSVVHTTA